ncbi:hypothetical protein BDN70DRAFT_784074, partial [Pholiota conissans]
KRQRLKHEVEKHRHPTFIHRLPVELLGDIFKLCLPEDMIDTGLYYKRIGQTAYTPLILSSICTRWRAISHSIPQLW